MDFQFPTGEAVVVKHLRVSVRSDVVAESLRRSLQIAAQCRADGIQLDVRTQWRVSEFSDTAVRQLRKMLDDLDLRITSVRFHTRRGYDQSEDLQRRVDATKGAMKLAYRLGCRCVVNSIGHVPDPEHEDYEQLAQVMDDLGRHGTHVGAFLAAETGANDPAALSDLLKRSEGGYVAVALNPGQLVVNRFSVDEALQHLGDRVLVVQAVDAVWDLSAGRGMSVPLGRGIVDFPTIMANLSQRGFDGDYVVGRLAMDRPDAEVADAVQYLRNLMV